MKRSNATRANRRATGAPPQPGVASFRISPVALRRLGTVAVWATVFGGVAYGLHTLEPVARALHGGSACTLRWIELPVWLSEAQSADVLREIEAAAGLRSGDDIFEPELCERVAAGLRACPWVAEVQRVTKQVDGIVRVRATFRRPLAMVVSDGTAHVVDAAGVRLPRQAPASDAGRYNFLLISGVRSPVPAVGAAWAAEDLDAGLLLAQFLEQAAAAGRAPVRAALRGVDVSNFGRRRNGRDGELRLLTNHAQSYIHWGLPPGREYDIECSAEQKLATLNGLFAQYGRWPEGRACDVRAHDSVSWGEPQ